MTVRFGRPRRRRSRRSRWWRRGTAAEQNGRASRVKGRIPQLNLIDQVQLEWGSRRSKIHTGRLTCMSEMQHTSIRSATRKVQGKKKWPYASSRRTGTASLRRHWLRGCRLGQSANSMYRGSWLMTCDFDHSRPSIMCKLSATRVDNLVESRNVSYIWAEFLSLWFIWLLSLPLTPELLSVKYDERWHRKKSCFLLGQIYSMLTICSFKHQ